jgi:CheY-like chemotaxis protein
MSTGKNPGALWGYALLKDVSHFKDLTASEAEFIKAGFDLVEARLRLREAILAAQTVHSQPSQIDCEPNNAIKPQRARNKPGRPTILVLDDEPEVLRCVHDLLRRDYRVITCTRGVDALKIIDAPGPIHVIMSDQRMPGMTGVEVLRHAKQVRPEATRLLFTAYADIRAVIDAINDAKTYKYITKPWDPEELQHIVQECVQLYDLNVERARSLAAVLTANNQLNQATRAEWGLTDD